MDYKIDQCPDCGKYLYEDAVHTCSPKTPDTVMRQAIEALELSLDDVRECLDNLRPHSGWAKYDRRITAYEAQIELHERAIADMKALAAASQPEPDKTVLPLGHKFQAFKQPAAWVGLMRGVRVDGDSVVISTKSNDTARQLCAALLQQKGAA